MVTADVVEDDGAFIELLTLAMPLLMAASCAPVTLTER